MAEGIPTHQVVPEPTNYNNGTYQQDAWNAQTTQYGQNTMYGQNMQYGQHMHGQEACFLLSASLIGKQTLRKQLIIATFNSNETDLKLASSCT